MCEIFQIFINFHEVSVEGTNEDVESQDVTLSLEFLGSKVECADNGENGIILIDGTQLIKNNFVLKPENFTENEDFMFKAIGNFVKVKLFLKKLVEKSKRKSEIVDVLYAEGSINLLQNLKKFTEKSENTHKIELVVLNFETTKISLSYEIKFENAPELHSTILLQIIDIHNFPFDKNENCEACFRFPFNRNFRTVLMHKNEYKQVEDNFCLIDDLLIKNNFEIDENPSSMNIFYENFQTECGFNLFLDFVKNNQKLLIELKFNDKMFMSFLDLSIFNHPGVTNVTFLVPLYEWNNKLITSEFQQEACFTQSPINETTSMKKRKSKRSSHEDEILVPDNILTPIISDENHVALKINLKLSKALYEEKLLESLTDELNEKFHYKTETNHENLIIKQSQNDFYCIIHQIANVLEAFINNHSSLSEVELMESLKKFTSSSEFCLKNEFKEVLVTLIGNTFNQEEMTETNNDFKLLMIKVFKSLNTKMNSILLERHEKKLAVSRVFMHNKARKYQIEEYIANEDFEKAENFIEQELNESLKEGKLKEKAFYLLKLKKYEKLEMILKKLLKISKYCTFSLYILSYLCVIKEDLDTCILILSILTKLKPSSMEYWILLMNLYEKTGNIPGMKFSSVKIQGTKFIPNYKLYDSVVHPEIIFIDPVACILWNQFKFSMLEYFEITKAFAQQTMREEFQWTIEKNFIEIIELINLRKYSEGLEILKGLSMDDENEITLRFLRGSILYDTNEKWKGICEYEIAFNLCLKLKLRCPLFPVLRCGFWYLYDNENLLKAKKYFHYCYSNFGTFQSCIGLGKTELKSSFFYAAEKSFNEANLIDQNSCENWVFLALTNCKLDNFQNTLSYYLKAKEMGVEESKELIEIEKYLDI